MEHTAKLLLLNLLFLVSLPLMAQTANEARRPDHLYLDSKTGTLWLMRNIREVNDASESISETGYNTQGWLPATVPGTVLNSLVENKVYPEPYYGLNNQLQQNIIPDLAKVGRDFYSYWFRTEFNLPADYKGKTVWLQIDGINYRAEVWLNGHLLTDMSGMFRPAVINITDFVNLKGANALALKVRPVDEPGTTKPKNWGAKGEWQNGGDGNIGLNTTMLMSVGWDFTFYDGIRDRNTGIWRSVSLFATKSVRLQYPFVKSKLNASYDRAEETVSVELQNPTARGVKCRIEGEIEGTGISFEKEVNLFRGETQVVEFSAKDFPQLVIDKPQLWWPVNKGAQHLYTLKLRAQVGNEVSDSLLTRFGIREIRSDQNTPDHSRQFYVNGKKIFIRGANWIPEAMLRQTDARMLGELRYTRQCGINLLRLWGGGIAESDYFYQLCDELGLLVWQEFWMTGDTRHPQDQDLYLSNMEATVKRIRNHAALAYYVSSNESTEMPGARDLIMQLDGTRGYQMQSECMGIHDGSPYKQVNPMRNYENTASDRGSRVDGFNPEYGAPTLPLASSLRRMMPERDLWPIDKAVWDYHDGGGFHLMTTLYKDLVDQYGPSQSIDEFAAKAQLVGAMNSKSIWEVWNENKYGYGDRYASGLLFWYLNCPVYQVCGRMWDYFLMPTASLYHTANALEPLHPQFDYLKNTVSVYNDYNQAFRGYTVIAEVYDLQSRMVWSHRQTTDIPEDGVVNDLFRISFPEDITQVHFIRLRLLDENGRQVGSNFYWRSRDKYQGKKTVTGPCTSGFSDLKLLGKTKLQIKKKVVMKDGQQLTRLSIKNTGKAIAFFVQLKLTNEKGEELVPAYLSDNFFSLVPGESKEVDAAVGSAKLSVTTYQDLLNL